MAQNTGTEMLTHLHYLIREVDIMKNYEKPIINTNDIFADKDIATGLTDWLEDNSVSDASNTITTYQYQS